VSALLVHWAVSCSYEIPSINGKPEWILNVIFMFNTLKLAKIRYFHFHKFLCVAQWCRVPYSWFFCSSIHHWSSVQPFSACFMSCEEICNTWSCQFPVHQSPASRHKISCTHISHFWCLFILQPISPSREFPGPVHVVEEWREMTKNATYRLLNNIGNKSFWKTTFRYNKNNAIFICMQDIVNVY
jgi:hypothetical protein